MRRARWAAALAFLLATPVAAQPQAGDLWLGVAAGRVGVSSFLWEDFSGPDQFEGPVLAISIERFGRAWWSYGARGSVAWIDSPDQYGGDIGASWWGLHAFTRFTTPSTVALRMTFGVEAAYGQVDDGPEVWQQGSSGLSAGLWLGPGLALDWGPVRFAVDAEVGMGPELADTGDFLVGRWLVGLDYALRRGPAAARP